MSLILRLDTTAAPAAMASNAANEYTAMLSASPVLTSDTDVSAEPESDVPAYNHKFNSNCTCSG